MMAVDLDGIGGRATRGTPGHSPRSTEPLKSVAGAMAERALYVVAYDICDPRRLRRVLAVVKAYSTGGQKSVHECFLSATEKTELVAALEAVVDAGEDSVLLIRLDPRARPRTLGIAVPPRDERFLYVG